MDYDRAILISWRSINRCNRDETKLTDETQNAFTAFMGRFEELLRKRGPSYWVTVGSLAILVIAAGTGVTLQELVKNQNLTEDLYDLVTGRIVIQPEGATHSAAVQLRLPNGDVIWSTNPIANSTSTEVQAIQLVAGSGVAQSTYTSSAIDTMSGTTVNEVFTQGFPAITLGADTQLTLMFASTTIVTVVGGYLVFKRRRKTKAPAMLAVQ
jgi:hypothetical protein